MKSDLVSVVIPVYNRAAMLREAVASVLAQTWRPIEIILVDDGSSDDTLAVAQELAAGDPEMITVLSRPNGGPGVARQTGLDAARGEFIQFLDSDDRLLARKFEWQVAGLRADPEAGIAYGKTYTRENGVRLAQPAQRSAEKHRTVFPALLTGRIWETSTPLYRREALDRIGRWPAKRQMEDWEFDAQAGAAGIQLHYCDEWLAEYVIHGEHRLASVWESDDTAFIDMVEAHLSMFDHARTAAVQIGSPEMDRFARTLFRLARRCAARAPSAVAARVLDTAAHATAPGSSTSGQLRIYRTASRLCGWRNIGKLCAWRERSAGDVLLAAQEST